MKNQMKNNKHRNKKNVSLERWLFATSSDSVNNNKIRIKVKTKEKCVKLERWLCPASSDSVKAGWQHFSELLSSLLPDLSFLPSAQIYLHLTATNIS